MRTPNLLGQVRTARLNVRLVLGRLPLVSGNRMEFVPGEVKVLYLTLEHRWEESNGVSANAAGPSSSLLITIEMVPTRILPDNFEVQMLDLAISTAVGDQVPTLHGVADFHHLSRRGVPVQDEVGAMNYQDIVWSSAIANTGRNLGREITRPSHRGRARYGAHGARHRSRLPCANIQ